MKSKVLTLLLFTIIASFSFLNAQSTLSFNRVITLDNTTQTVPAGKVWKVTGVYGLSDNICYPYFNLNFGTVRYALGFGLALVVNGQTIVFQITDRTGGSHFPISNCSGSGSTNWNPSQPKIEPNPNAFPMWLPAGSTLATGGSSTIASVIEFDVVP
jgi:hypothetical protein